MVNWKRLSQYKDNGIAVILDTYLQGTKVKKDGRWQYRKWISEETVCDLLDPFGTQRLYKVRQQAREAFGLMAVHGCARIFPPLMSYEAEGNLRYKKGNLRYKMGNLRYIYPSRSQS
jgi:hypothetical protein